MASRAAASFGTDAPIHLSQRPFTQSRAFAATIFITAMQGDCDQQADRHDNEPHRNEHTRLQRDDGTITGS